MLRLPLHSISDSTKETLIVHFKEGRKVELGGIAKLPLKHALVPLLPSLLRSNIV